MAIIHEGKNGLREKLEEYYADQLRKRKELFDRMLENDKADYEMRVAAHKRAIPIRLGVIALCIALIAVLVLCPDIVQSIQSAADTVISGWEEALGDAMRDEMTKSHEDIGGILLNLLLGLLSLIASGLLWLVHTLSGVLVYILCFGAPAVAAFFVARGLRAPRKPDLDRTFDEEDKMRWIREDLPDDMKILKSGLEGEERALELLSRLDDDCHIYTNLMIRYDGRVSETDVIVVAPNNVTIVEVKNYRDELRGDWSDEHITIEAARGSTVHENQVYNPVRQVATHAWRLGQYLRENSLIAAVNRCVFFVNEEVQLYMMTDEKDALIQCPVFESRDLPDLLAYLREHHKATPGKRVAQLLTALAEEQR